MRLNFVASGLVLNIATANALQSHQNSARDSNITSITSSQAVNGSGQFIGYITCLKPLEPKTQYLPDASMMHQDGGNTGSTDYAGPIGKNITMSTFSTRIAPFLFDPSGGVTAGEPGTSGYSLKAVDPETLGAISSWSPPTNQTLNLAYIQQIAAGNDSIILVTSTQGRVFVVQRNNSVSPPTFTTSKDIDVSHVLQPGEQLLNGMYDTLSNIWFTTGVILGLAGTPENTTTVGYITPSDQISTIHLQNQAVENGIAVSNTTVYVVTGPPGGDTMNSTGNMYAFQAGGAGVKTVWSAPYDAGSKKQPGGFARGSGTTPTLLGNAYIAVTDHADTQTSLLIYHQTAQECEDAQLLCKVPIFAPGASAVDVGSIGHASEHGYSAVLFNDYNAPPIYPSANATASDINGAFNNMTIMAAGGVRVEIPLVGSDCKIAWEKDIRMKSVPILSTKTGLLYGYEQDIEDAENGEWVWYVTARNWETGDLVWKVQTGAGGSFNDDFQGNAIGKDGRLYQGVVGGIVALKDGDGAT
ncbi:hypothetical protein LOCC1_G004674 [Lachnellula occidentalis]|uniref:Uncharacterized protein n=1 Tax=Lachnellula occidentalis TaxID=215460 RepID=A0A8H8S3V2_9HELO|nr:hypothetical protein LOCC1_G004674 [Lachnellula occidentalis]